MKQTKHARRWRGVFVGFDAGATLMRDFQRWKTTMGRATKGAHGEVCRGVGAGSVMLLTPTI